MGNPYTSQTIAGYNSSPPPDDGTQSEANRVNWSKHIDKIGDPLKTLAEGVNSSVSTAFGKIAFNNINTQAGNYTVQDADQGKLIQVTAAATITTPAAGTVGVPFMFSVRNDHTDSITIDGNGTETIDGNLTFTLPAGNAVILLTDGSNWFSGSSIGVTISNVQDQTYIYAVDSGAADAYVVTLAVAPSAYAAGQKFAFKVTNTNTGASTVDFNSLGATAIVMPWGDALLGGELVANQIVEVTYDGTSFMITSPPANIGVLRGHIDGLVLANDTVGGDLAHDINIGVGEASDENGHTIMRITDAVNGLTKRIDASWAVGDDGGGLDGTESVTGTPDADTWYHVWLIRRSDTGVVDALFSESATAPTQPAAEWDQQRRIGAVFTDGSANIIQFLQSGNDFRWKNPPVISAVNPGTSAVNRTLRTPLGIVVKALVNASIIDTTPATRTVGYFSSLGVDDEAASITLAPLGQLAADSTDGDAVAAIEIYTNVSSQIRTRLSASTADHTLRISTIGWEDPRGRNL